MKGTWICGGALLLLTGIYGAGMVLGRPMPGLLVVIAFGVCALLR